MAQDVARVYNASPTLSEFHASDAAIRLVRGPVGSGKSVALGAIEVVRRASEMPPDQDGVRRSRCVVVRNTLQQLKSTCLVTLQEWIRPISFWKVSEATLFINFTPADGIPVSCEVLMLPLDTVENQQRLLSLELTFAWVSEFREVPLEILQAVFSRCGRYPSRANVKSYWYGLWGETNSFSEDSEYHDFLEVERPSNVDYFIQPGAFDEGAENRENLPPRYYEDLLEANTPAWCEQYIHNRVTPSLSGQAVFAKTFNPEFHIRERLYPDFSRPIVLGVDTGRNPALVAGQIDVRGRLLVLGSIWAENMGIEKFIATTGRPFLLENFQGGKFFISMDPAGRQRSQIGEESVKMAVERLGYSVILAPTNDITPRLRAVERYLNLQIDGGGGLLVDRRLNNDLILALQKNYRYPRDKKGVLAEKPDKGHPESDLCFAEGTPVLTPDGYVNIETLKAGDEVVTPSGVQVIQAASSRLTEEYMTVGLSNGCELVCTPNHPFIGRDTCIVNADELQYLDSLLCVNDIKWLDTIVSGLTDFGSNSMTEENTLSPRKTESSKQCIDTSGSITTGLSQKECTSTTLTTIARTTPSEILKCWMALNTNPPICRNDIKKEMPILSPRMPESELQSGMEVKKEGSGIVSMGSNLLETSLSKNTSVRGVGKYTKSNVENGKGDFVPPAVREWREKLRASIMPIGNVPSVEKLLALGDMGQQKPALKVAKTNQCLEPEKPIVVVNLQVACDPVYFVADALVHNCDGLQYLCLSAASNVLARAMTPAIAVAPPPPTSAWT